MEEFGIPQAAVAGIALLVMTICFGIVSAILDHHWSRYEIEPGRRRRARRVYYAGAGILFVLMLVSFIFLII